MNSNKSQQYVKFWKDTAFGSRLAHNKMIDHIVNLSNDYR